MIAREFGTPYKSNTTLIQFKRTMDREGVTCTTYTGGIEFKAFFRTRDDNENQKETAVLYYDINAPVRPGTLICYGYGVFLALNRESVENNVYYKSTIVKCNGFFRDNINYNIGNIPFYTGSINSTISIGNQTIAMLNGNIEFLTEDNSLSRMIALEQTFNEFGRTFKVCNRFCMDGITHIMAEVYANIEPSITRSIVIDGMPTSASVGDTFHLSATAYENDRVISNASYAWSSSDITVATIDGLGNVSVISSGAVSFTVRWVEQDIIKNSDILSINGGDIPTPAEYTAALTYSGEPEIRIGASYKTITAHLFDSRGKEVTDLVDSWSFEVEYDYPSEITTSQTGNKLKMKASDKVDIIGTLLVLNATESTFGVTTSKIFNITDYL